VFAATIIRAMSKLMMSTHHPEMEAASTTETSGNFYQTTWRNIPEDSNLHTRHRENLKSHPQFVLSL
jgi:hypothetical protein